MFGGWGADPKREPLHMWGLQDMIAVCTSVLVCACMCVCMAKAILLNWQRRFCVSQLLAEGGVFTA